MLAKSDIGIIYGDQGKDNTKIILEKYNIQNRFSWQGTVVGIKPNLVLASPAEEGATTDPEIVAGIIEYLQSLGVKKIKILEGSWVGENTENAFQTCGYNQLASKYNIELIDLKKDKTIEKKAGDLNLHICKQILEVDILINVPVLKAHCQTRLTCALKNMKGCIPDSEKRRYHRKGLHKPIALLNKIIKTDLIIVDAIYGDLTFEEGGNPVKMDRILIGQDPVLIDAYAARLLGFDINDIDYINYAEKYGAGNAQLNQANITEYNKPDTLNELNGRVSTIPGKLSEEYLNEKSACSACSGNLIFALYRLHERGKLKNIDREIYIGQGYKNESISGSGIGSCTNNFQEYLPGCPPETDRIVSFIEKILNS